ncbi:MAG: hypothetical protein NT128_03040 [Proteobacteria bacterium]|nr:hypothetical protein [Pseudomonadota bacterium]
MFYTIPFLLLIRVIIRLKDAFYPDKLKITVLTARFIEVGDIADGSPILADVKKYVGVTNNDAEWAKSKTIITDQIARNVVRRVLFFINDKLIGSCGVGRIPIAVESVKNGAGGFEFSNDQETIASAYRNLVGKGAVEVYDEDSSTWSLTKAGAPILAVTLIPNEERDARIISKMHKAAYSLFVGLPISGFDTLPSLYVSMVRDVNGIMWADFGKFLSLQKSHLYPGDRTLIHNYFPEKTDGRCFMLAGRINQ